jgi:NADH:ubiquinone oxidoreductase subunit 5 (subunit L)/multisubunit Na+/H+ antiporter MnhA subunit
MYLLILFIPLFSAIVGGLFGRHLGGKGAGLLTSTCIVVTAFLS